MKSLAQPRLGRSDECTEQEADEELDRLAEADRLRVGLRNLRPRTAHRRLMPSRPDRCSVPDQILRRCVGRNRRSCRPRGGRHLFVDPQDPLLQGRLDRFGIDPSDERACQGNVGGHPRLLVVRRRLVQARQQSSLHGDSRGRGPGDRQRIIPPGDCSELGLRGAFRREHHVVPARTSELSSDRLRAPRNQDSDEHSRRPAGDIQTLVEVLRRRRERIGVRMPDRDEDDDAQARQSPHVDRLRESGRRDLSVGDAESARILAVCFAPPDPIRPRSR